MVDLLGGIDEVGNGKVSSVVGVDVSDASVAGCGGASYGCVGEVVVDRQVHCWALSSLGTHVSERKIMFFSVWLHWFVCGCVLSLSRSRSPCVLLKTHATET